MEYSPVFLSGLRPRSTYSHLEPGASFPAGSSSAHLRTTFTSVPGSSFLCAGNGARRSSRLSDEGHPDSEDIIFTPHEPIHLRRASTATINPPPPPGTDGPAPPAVSPRNVPRTVLRPRSYTDSLPPRSPPPMRPLPSSPTDLNSAHHDAQDATSAPPQTFQKRKIHKRESLFAPIPKFPEGTDMTVGSKPINTTPSVPGR